MEYQVKADDVEINKKNLNTWIEYFKNKILPKRIELGKYYDGENEIIKTGAVKGRPNYKINVNMAKYIIDVSTAYTFGIPIKYETQNGQKKDILKKLQDILKNCNVNAIDFQQGGDMATYGISYQLVLAPDNSDNSAKIEDRIRLKNLDPLHTFYVVDNTILENPVCGVYLYDYVEKEQTKTKIYVYDEVNLSIFDGSNGVYELTEQEPHNMGSIPLIQCLNNDDAYGDIYAVTPLLDSLSLCVSNNTDNLQSIANAILAVSGGVLNQDKIDDINTYKVANLPIGAKMEWILKNINPEAEKMQVDNLLKFLFQISQVPDLTDDAFGGNQSGVAMQYKIWGLNQLWATKTAKYEQAVYQRLKIILHLLQYQIANNIELLTDITVTFSKNLPENYTDLMQIVQNIKDIVSKKSVLKLLPFIENVDDEMKQIDEEAEKNADLYGFNNNANLNNNEGNNAE